MKKTRTIFVVSMMVMLLLLCACGTQTEKKEVPTEPKEVGMQNDAKPGNFNTLEAYDEEGEKYVLDLNDKDEIIGLHRENGEPIELMKDGDKYALPMQLFNDKEGKVPIENQVADEIMPGADGNREAPPGEPGGPDGHGGPGGPPPPPNGEERREPPNEAKTE